MISIDTALTLNLLADVLFPLVHPQAAKDLAAQPGSGAIAEWDQSHVNYAAAVVAAITADTDQGSDLRAALGVAAVTSEGDPSQHVVEIRDSGWTIQHPLACRTGGRSLFDCRVNRAAENDPDSWPRLHPGRYYCRASGSGRLLIGARVPIADYGG